MGPGLAAGVAEDDLDSDEGTVDRVHDYVGDTVEALARRLDDFFAGDLAYLEATGSYLQIGGSALWEQGRDWKFDDRIRLRLVLPRTQKRFRLVLESEREPEETRPAEEDRPVPPPPSESRSTLLGLEGSLQETRRWRVSLTGGVKFPLPPDPFVRLRGRLRVPVASWHFRFTQSLFWFRSDGYGETTAVDLDRSLSGNVLFRSSSSATFLLDESNFELAQSFGVYHHLSSRDALTYSYSVLGETNPRTQVTDHVVGVRYRRSLYRDWLFFEVEPGLRFSRDDDFQRIAFVGFKLDAVARDD